MKNSKNNFISKTILVICFIAITFGYSQREVIQHASENQKLMSGTCSNSSGEITGYYGYCVSGNNSCIATACPSN